MAIFFKQPAMEGRAVPAPVNWTSELGGGGMETGVKLEVGGRSLCPPYGPNHGVGSWEGGSFSKTKSPPPDTEGKNTRGI